MLLSGPKWLRRDLTTVQFPVVALAMRTRSHGSTPGGGGGSEGWGGVIKGWGGGIKKWGVEIMG